MPQSKPKPGPYQHRCDLCYKRGEFLVFDSHEAYMQHLKGHFFAAAPFRILAIAR